MQLDQIIIRPAQKRLVIQYSDDLKQPINVSSDSTGDANVAALVQYAEQHMPTAATRPDKPQIEIQIADLQKRIDRLKKSIGQT
jgi:hypothetical protein